MRTWSFSFWGRRVGAIGVFHQCFQQVQAEQYEEALKRLYDTHEHISSLTHSMSDPDPNSTPVLTPTND